MTDKILYAAVEVRETLEAEQKTNKPWQDNLCGACAVGSVLLKKKLEEQGIETLFVLGSHPQVRGSHCWLEIGGKVIDVTASQLDLPLKIYYGNKTKDYKTIFWNKRAEENVESWGEKQSPSEFPHLFL